VKVEEVANRLRSVTGREPDKTDIDYAKKRIARQVGRVPGDAYAYSTSDDIAGGISVNTKYGKDAAKMQESLGRDVLAGFHPPGHGSVKAVVDHEMAHEIDKLLGLATRREFTDPGLRAIVSQYTPEQIVNGLSRYAKTNPKEVIAEVHLHYEVLEDNLERGNLESHIMRLIAERASLDLEEWMLSADTGSGDAYLALTDGIIKRSTSNVVDKNSSGNNASNNTSKANGPTTAK
jgi:hypothetical protein